MKPIVVPEHGVEKGQYVRAWLAMSARFAPLIALVLGLGRVLVAALGAEEPLPFLPAPAIASYALLGVAYAIAGYVLCLVALRASVQSRLPLLTERGIFRPQRLSIEEGEIVRTSPVGGTERIPLAAETVGAVSRDVLFLWASDGSGVRLALPLAAFGSPAERVAALRHLKERRVLRWGWHG